MTHSSAQDIAASVSAALRREFPELRVRDAAMDRALVDAGVFGLVVWLVERIPVDPRLARAGAARICDGLLRDGFARRPLIRAISLVEGELVRVPTLDPSDTMRVTTAVHELLTHRLVPDAPVDGAGRVRVA